MKKTASLLALVVACAVSVAGAAESPLATYFKGLPAGMDPGTISRRVTDQFLSSRPENYRPKGYHGNEGYGWNRAVQYSVVSLWLNAISCARLVGDKAREAQLVKMFDDFLPGRPKNRCCSRPYHVDDTIFGALPLEVARLTGCKTSLDLGLRYADLQWSAPDERTVNPQNFSHDEQQKLFADGYTPETRFWIDDMYMITFLQVQAYRATGDLKYLSRTAKELALYIGKLQRPDGLFDHAPGVPFVWGRGDGWVSGGLTLLMRYLPKDDPNYPAVRKGYERMMAGLLRNQRANGLWGQLVDDSGSWDETSGSAMFAYGFVTGVKLGILDRATYAPAARKAYLALVGKLDQYANLADVCEGTVKKNDRNHYLARPRVNGAPYGQAALMWICNALLEE